VSGAATRWRLIELQRQRRAIGIGADLLERKREGLLRALAARSRAARSRRARLAGLLAAAHAVLDDAVVEIGEAAALGAAIAQPRTHEVTVSSDAVIGVHVPRLAVKGQDAGLNYGPGGTCARLDEAVRTFTALLPEITSLAEDEGAERSLKRGLKRTTRTLNALRIVLLPAVDADIRAIASGLDEEEREEAVRWRTGRSQAPGSMA
jgi:H(+)-transporting ATP synthase subunit D